MYEGNVSMCITIEQCQYFMMADRGGMYMYLSGINPHKRIPPLEGVG